MAAPQVSGVVALMLQADPSLAPTTVKAILMYTAQKLELNDAQGRPLSRGLSVLTQGAGSLNALGAVELASGIDPARPVGSGWLRAAISKQTTIAGSTFSWAQHILWNDHELSGDALMSIHQALWSDNALWGDNATWSDNAVWSDNGVAADQALWSDNALWGDMDLAGESAASAENVFQGEE